MSLKALQQILESTGEYQRLFRTLSADRAGARSHVLREAAPFAISTLRDGLGCALLVIAPRPEDARRLYEQLVVWSGDERSVLHFPETESLPFERLVTDVATTQHRVATLAQLSNSAGGSIVVASAAAVAQRTIDPGVFNSSRHTLKRGQHIALDETLALWNKMGYRFEAAVDTPGAASRRGGIIDIFPVGAEMPARIELWGDEIDSIRLFDQVSQRSSEIVDSVTVLPAHETLPALMDADKLAAAIGMVDVSNCASAVRERISEELDLLAGGSDVEEMSFYAGLFDSGSLLDYFPDDGLVVAYRPTDIAAAAWESDERAHELRAVKEARGELPHGLPAAYSVWSQVEERLAHFHRRLDILPWGTDETIDPEVGALPFGLPSTLHGNVERIGQGVKDLVRGGHRVVACSAVPHRLAEILDEHNVHAQLVDELTDLPDPGSVTVVSAVALSDGFTLTVDGHRLVVLSDQELFGVAKQRRGTRSASRRRESLLTELNPGDYVVHVEHGIARFVGTERADDNGEGREYMVLEYAAKDRLKVPMDHLDRVTPYVAPLERVPSLTRLGTQEWRRAKERVERSTREMAAELLSLYAERELVKGRASGADTPWQLELEDSFPFQETPDQQAAVVDVKADMEQPSPMDRLVCGDVGYGKTEVAVRAAFKAVADGKQVAVLVPTTVLAQQHYLTFSQRLRAYPVKVDVLSRFRTDTEQRQVVEGLASGQIDICIGTHRLIQNDVSFHDLGLVVIDEEQRFGVDQKERLKKMRTEVDVLTMTATPIPRTLHLSLAGIRDMSTIETPPEERLPIKTYVSKFGDDLVREVVRRELDRRGQVFFLHNRVYNIDYFAEYVRNLVPEARVAVAHGQMAEDGLERTMLSFAEGEIDVLVCTTIIESGLDLPNVNTLLVNRADTFGLAQLYQLRGRVGRGLRRAYAYLMVPPSKSLSEAAEKRLKTMLAATELGAGFDIAMKDLEIRGAGNILGSQQSGHIHAIGFDLYTRLLNEAVEEIRGRVAAGVNGSGGDDGVEGRPSILEGLDLESPAATSVDLGIPGSLPESYVADLPIRLSIYQKLGRITHEEAVVAIEDEMADRFGALPWQAHNLLYILRLKIAAANAGVKSVRRDRERIVISLTCEVGGARRPLEKALGNAVEIGHAQLRMQDAAEGWETRLMETVVRLGEFRDRIAAGAREAASSA